MFSTFSSSLLPLLRLIDPERAHRLGLLALKWGLVGRDHSAVDPALTSTVFGLVFDNPIGLAAGFDKDAVAALALMRLGFGFVETGTVTPRPQAGNPKPRLFRLAEDRAVINRMGFNNGGLDRYLSNFNAVGRGSAPLGANVGINKEGADPERDYPALIAAVSQRADYVVINVSSPNTPGLRDLQSEDRLAAILAAVRVVVPARPPLLVKIAPDLSAEGLEAVVEVCVAAGVDGLIVSNTTISRPNGLRSPQARETGGLSGAPLFDLSTRMLARAYLLARGKLVLIGAGGIRTGADALTKIQAGASLVQLYSEFAYVGPALIPRMRQELSAALRARGFARIQDAIGTEAAAHAEPERTNKWIS
jgi:dihydroorotate dehydrogenase